MADDLQTAFSDSGNLQEGFNAFENTSFEKACPAKTLIIDDVPKPEDFVEQETQEEACKNIDDDVDTEGGVDIYNPPGVSFNPFGGFSDASSLVKVTLVIKDYCTNLPIEGALISLQAEGGSPFGGWSTNVDGRVYVGQLPENTTYTIKIIKAGYISSEFDVLDNDTFTTPSVTQTGNAGIG